MESFSTLVAGFTFSLSLIVAIGAQNAFVLRQGLHGQHVSTTVAICWLSDVVLMSLGIAGVGAAIDRSPQLLAVLTVAGAAFLLSYGALALRRAFTGSGALQTTHEAVRDSLLLTAGACLAITWLNPHVYLDTLVLLGSVANTQRGSRWWFGIGAIAASALWFSSLGFGARWLRPLFARESAWRTLDIAIALIMTTMAILLLLRV